MTAAQDAAPLPPLFLVGDALSSRSTFVRRSPRAPDVVAKLPLAAPDGGDSADTSSIAGAHAGQAWGSRPGVGAPVDLAESFDAAEVAPIGTVIRRRIALGSVSDASPDLVATRSMRLEDASSAFERTPSLHVGSVRPTPFDVESVRTTSRDITPVRAMRWASYVGCIVATLGAVSSAAFAADTIATILVAVGALLPVVWAMRPESRDISAAPKISAAS